MVEFKRILCPTDLSDASRPAMTYAAAFAGWYGSRLEILHVVPTFDAIQVPPDTFGGPVQVMYPASREEVTSEVQRAAAAAGVDVGKAALAAEAGDAASVIVDRALDSAADLVVLGTHGRSGFDRLIHGSVTEQVLQRSPCPVLTIPPQTPAGAPAQVVFRRILCAMDFSPAALQALGFALDLGRQANGRVTVLHVVEWLAEHEPRQTAHFNVTEYRTHLLKDAHERLDEVLVGEPRTWCEIEPVVDTGRAYRRVLDRAGELGADLIVMGAQGRGGVGLALAGSTTNQVVRAASCPVLTVRSAATA
jgi:nucleotide-binding universal stress UspA family protein